MSAAGATTDFVAAYEEVVRRHGARLAIEDANARHLSHAELWRAAGERRDELMALGVGEEDVVAIGFARSIELVVAMLAVWRAGAAWTVVEPTLPARHRARLVEIADARVVIDAEGIRRIDRVSSIGRRAFASPLAYVAFTSGSSGEPKGVRIEHVGLVPMLRAQIEAFALSEATRALWVLSPSFDASVSDVGTVWLAGGALLLDETEVLVDRARLLEVITRREVTAIDLPPSVLARLDIEGLPPLLQTIVIGGEVANVEAVRRAAARHRVVNVYGPTEATVCTSLEVCDVAWKGGTLGAPLPHVRYREVDGELLIGGPCLARDYAGDAEATAQRFVIRDGERWYRTGDRVRRDGDAWCFEGRLDRQVKLGGKRAEPGEVEAALRELGVEAAVVPREIDERTVLVAFVEGDGLDVAALHAGLGERLPAWLLPTRWRTLASLPRTERGKVDLLEVGRLSFDGQGILHITDARSRVSGDSSWPEDPAARRLAELFAVVLGRAVVGADDDFFLLGGDSLAVLSLLARAESTGIALTASQVFLTPTPAALARPSRDPERRTIEDLARLVPVLRHAARSTEPRVGSRGAVVLTGATGSLGARLRRALVARGHEVIALVRAPSDEVARQRVGGEALAADVALPQLGLASEVYDECVARAALVVHLAARVSLAASVEALTPANVDGTKHALALATDARVPFLHASTLSVFVASARADRVFAEDDDATTPTTIAGGYAQSKWIAEQLVRGADVPTCIVRYGLLTPDRRDLVVQPGRLRPFGATSDWLVRFVREVASHGAPRGLDTDALGFDATPLDHAVDATVRLIDREARGTFHIAGAAPISARRLLHAIRELGVIAHLPRSSSVAEASVLGVSRALDAERFARHRALDLFAATGVRFDDRRARAFGVEPPAVDDDYLRACVRAMVGTT